MDREAGCDFFISYTGVNVAWARWIAVELERAGYTTVVQAFDFRPGANFVHEMQRATASASRTIAVLSPTYVGSRFAESEWAVAFAADPTGERGLLLPVRVQPCEPPGLLATRVFVDLVDVDEALARERLLAAIGPPPPRVTNEPFPGQWSDAAPSWSTFPASVAARFPGAGPSVSNLGARDRHFTGRDAALVRLHERLHGANAGAVAVLPVEAVYGLGGVGKTTLALEFAHQFASDYDLIWWIAADQPTTAAAGLAGLAHKLGVTSDGDQAALIETLFEQLRSRTGWLLIYDNAERPQQLTGLLPPGGGGHVVVTSRWSAWNTAADPLPLDVLDRAESVYYLQQRTGSGDTVVAGELAELVGDLPLALAEVAGYVEQTRIELADYRDLLRNRARDLFGLAGAESSDESAEADSRRVATVWSVSLEQIRVRAPAAESLMTLCTFLSPEIPRTLPGAYPDLLPDPLRSTVDDPLAYNAALRVLGQFSMVTLTPSTIAVHRLVQAVVRARLDRTEEQAWAQRAVAVIRAGFPNAGWEAGSWPGCEQLLPHLLVVVEHAERLDVAGEQAWWLLDRASTYLRERGQYRQALPLAQRALTLTEAALGADHVSVGWRCDGLGRVLRALGDLTGARIQHERALQIGEAALGPDHPTHGIWWRSSLGRVLQDLGDLTGARTQHERALEISEAALGPDHPATGVRRSNLGSVLRDLGDLTGSRTQHERALQISEAALGPDHPDIGARRNDLGLVLQDLGDLSGARTQYERALQIGEAALGPDHPEIGIWRNNLGLVLQDLGDLTGARTQLERALQISEAALGPDHSQTSAARATLRSIPPA